MIPEEFKTQIFKTPEQWESGLLYRLIALEKGGITLYSTPAFAQWIIKLKNRINNPLGLAVDEFGQVYLFDWDIKSKICKLYRYDCQTQNLEQLPYIIDHYSGQENVKCPRRMLLAKYTLWVNDFGNKRVLAFSRDDYLLKNIINKVNDEIIEPVDIGLNECGHIYVLAKKSNDYIIIKYDEHGNFIYWFFIGLTSGKNNTLYIIDRKKEVVGLASGKNNVLYVVDRKEKKLLKFKEEVKDKEKGLQLVLDKDFTVDLSKDEIDVQLSGIVVDKNGNIFLSDCKESIHQFYSDGSSLGKVQSFKGIIQGLDVDSKGNLYVSSYKGIYKLEVHNKFTKEEGTYYSKPLDSGIRECQWHGIVMEADVPPKTTVEISYILSDDLELKEKIDNEIADKTKSKQEKAEYIERQLKDKWSESEKFLSNYSDLKEKDTNLQMNPTESKKNSGYMLFKGQKGRYLWLKVVLLTFDEAVTPTVTQMKIYYPRISYLRYLPAIYQEDPASKDFLERFLSIFETMSDDLEIKISHIYNYFDPDLVPLNFLNWLASWLNIALEEEWQEEQKRQLIREAYSLYKQKGTPSGIARLIEICTGKKPVLLENSKIEKPIVLRENGPFRLGINSLLLDAPFRGIRLGDECILGKVAIRDPVLSPEDPFLSRVHRFTITLDLSENERIRKQVERILDEGKPAHTEYNLRFSRSVKEMETTMGMNTKLDYYNPLLLGESTIGSVIVATNGEWGGKVGKRSGVGLDIELI